MSSAPDRTLVARLARRLELPERGVAAVLGLLDEQATVPFIARYRKEATGGLDEVQIRAIAESKTVWADLEKRRATVLKSIQEQGLLTPELEGKVRACETRTELEDVYLPYRPKRRTRATVARERGLSPLAELILNQPRSGQPDQAAHRYVSTDNDVPDTAAALAGARDIVAEAISEQVAVRALVRRTVSRFGALVSKRARGQDKDERTPYEQYYEHSESVGRVPSHRYLAMARGERDGALKVKVDIDVDRLMFDVMRQTPYDGRSSFAAELEAAVRDSLDRLVLPAVERELRKELKTAADRDAVDVFGKNLRALLLAAPLGQAGVIGIDPGLRTGCKVVALDATGRLLDHTVLHVIRDERRAGQELERWVQRYRPRAIAVGNGTGSREAMSVARRAAKALDGTVAVEVNEAGASVYSASDVAREEFPDLDLTVRGAISIGRRLQDPLAELVKVEPKSIGVGQYQHDVDQALLGRKLGEVVESCVNHVGVELNTASAPLLSFVAGIGPKLATRIVAHRDSNGPFTRRRELLKVSGLGARTFEQCAGFLRIRDGSDPLDASAVHPERYSVVKAMAKDLGVPVGTLVGDSGLAGRIRVSDYVDGDLGEPTLRDIVAELARPGRDPRDAFEAMSWSDEITEVEHLREGMVLQGKVTNVTHFGAFVDLGVHQDGLVHISELSDEWIDDPHRVVSPGQPLRVRVLSVDLGRRRIALSAKL